MSYPTQVTVGSLLEFLNSQLAKGNVDAETPIYIEVYSLTPEEEQLKAKQCSMTPEEQEAQDLDYHIPDDSPDERCHFGTGVWQACPDGRAREEGGHYNTVALSIYLQKQEQPFRAGRESSASPENG